MLISKSPREIELMKQAGKAVGLTFKALESEIKAGMTTLDIDAIVDRVFKENGCISAEKGY